MKSPRASEDLAIPDREMDDTAPVVRHGRRRTDAAATTESTATAEDACSFDSPEPQHDCSYAHGRRSETRSIFPDGEGPPDDHEPEPGSLAAFALANQAERAVSASWATAVSR